MPNLLSSVVGLPRAPEYEKISGRLRRQRRTEGIAKAKALGVYIG